MSQLVQHALMVAARSGPSYGTMAVSFLLMILGGYWGGRLALGAVRRYGRRPRGATRVLVLAIGTLLGIMLGGMSWLWVWR